MITTGAGDAPVHYRFARGGCWVDEADEALMERYAREGDRAAFRVLFERYGGPLQGFFLRGVRDAVVAQDLVQTTFLHVHRARRDFDPTRPFKPWLYTIATNVRREHWRRKKRKPESPLEPGQEGSVQPEASSASDRLVRRALQDLPDNQREVLLLRWYAGLSFPEIATSLGIQTNAAKVRSHRAMKALRALLGGDHGG